VRGATTTYDVAPGGKWAIHGFSSGVPARDDSCGCRRTPCADLVANDSLKARLSRSSGQVEFFSKVDIGVGKTLDAG